LEIAISLAAIGLQAPVPNTGEEECRTPQIRMKMFSNTMLGEYRYSR
jgi:hypothetical protein